MICKKCNYQNVENAKFCNECGEKLQSSASTCSKCNCKNDYGTKFCRDCGAMLTNGKPPSVKTSKKIWIIYAIVLFVCALIGIFMLIGNKKEKKDKKEKVQLLDTITFENENYYAKYEYDNKKRISRISFHYEGEPIHAMMFTYDGKDIKEMIVLDVEDKTISESVKYTKKGNKISWEFDSYDDNKELFLLNLNNEGYPIKLESSYVKSPWNNEINYEYQKKNLTKFTDYSYKKCEIENKVIATCETTVTFNYDNNKSPFYHCKSPKMIFYFFREHHKQIQLFGGIGNNNNVTEISEKQICNYWNIDSKSKQKYKYEYDRNGFPTKMTTINEDGEEGLVMLFKYTYK